MKVKLIYEPTDLSWSNSKIITVQDSVCESDIKSMFKIELGIPYNKHDCSFEALDGHIFTDKEVYGYTE